MSFHSFLQKKALTFLKKKKLRLCEELKCTVPIAFGTIAIILIAIIMRQIFWSFSRRKLQLLACDSLQNLQHKKWAKEQVKM
jgi:hypothetical protein